MQDYRPREAMQDYRPRGREGVTHPQVVVNVVVARAVRDEEPGVVKVEDRHVVGPRRHACVGEAGRRGESVKGTA